MLAVADRPGNAIENSAFLLAKARLFSECTRTHPPWARSSPDSCSLTSYSRGRDLLL